MTRREIIEVSRGGRDSVPAPVDFDTLRADVARVKGRIVSWADYGTTAAGLVAAATAAGPGGTIFAPRGPADAPYTYTLEAQVTLTEISLVSDGAEISAAADLGSGVAALVFDSPAGNYPNIRCEGFRLYGPTYGARTLGAAPCAMDGIEVRNEAKVHFRDLWVRFFRSGFVLNNVVGHLYWDAVQADNNYYGVYLQQTGYDYYVRNSIINGNTFANFGAKAGQGWEAVAFENSHIGFAPYAFYQEATPAATGIVPFLGDARFYGARFEALGNGAFLSEAPNDASNRNITRNLLIVDPGFSWNDTYKIAARPRDYAIDVPYTEGKIAIHGGLYPFAAGALGRIRIKQANHVDFLLDYEGAAESHVVKTAGAGPVRAVSGVGIDGIMTVADAGASRIARLAGSAGAYLDFTADNTKRIGADPTAMYADTTDFRWRNSGASYGTVGRVHGGGIVMPKYYLADAGADGGPFLTFGSGSPEGAVTAPVGSLYVSTSGGATTTLYVKTSGAGATGWTAK